eukprot:TRINITY_DN1601_c0_g1_i1.p1 TRINITY_DN1601_c0_g1~~TRINITY_DN1601_c0_g1_i1.p1  ORF type:complete len:222 (-),score=29.67 TRINITY_DN1601_c0_g1_i1:98-763(-)
MESKVSGDGGDSGLWHAQVGDRTTSEEVVYNGKFLKAKTIHYTRGTLHKLWEGCDRTTRGSGGIDAVAIFTIIKSKKEGWAKTVLVKQYRPPIKNVSVEFPAGLIDEGETPDITAIRELKEETGYTGTVVSVSPVCVADPGLSSANMAVVTVHVDADAKENLKPVQMQVCSPSLINLLGVCNVVTISLICPCRMTARSLKLHWWTWLSFSIHYRPGQRKGF